MSDADVDGRNLAADRINPLTASCTSETDRFFLSMRVSNRSNDMVGGSCGSVVNSFNLRIFMAMFCYLKLAVAMAGVSKLTDWKLAGHCECMKELSLVLIVFKPC